MVSKLKTFDLDTSSPRGWCKLGEPGDACEHGHQINKEDIERLKAHYNLQISEHIFNNNKYRLISLLNEGATDTVVSILGGDGKYYVVDSTILPDGLIMPLFEQCKNKKLNLIIIDPEYELEWAWNSSLTSEFKHFSNLTKYLNKKLPSMRHLILTMFKNNNRLLSSKISWLKRVQDFVIDFELILKHIKNVTQNNLWLMGHCSSTMLISVINDLNLYNNYYKGVIFLNPFWQQDWKKTIGSMEYFLNPMQKPLLVIQHRDDKTIGANSDIAKKIVRKTNNPMAKFIELSGGTDKGCPTFSMGYHGFRDLENILIEEINSFIKEEKGKYHAPHKIFDLDITSPYGWGIYGIPGDACEHGHMATDFDLEILKKHYNLQISEHTFNNNKYRLISLLNEDATDTVVSILGGDGKYYVVDANVIPNGLVMPFFEYCREHKLNLIIIDPIQPLENSWNSKIYKENIFLNNSKFWNSEDGSLTIKNNKIHLKNIHTKQKQTLIRKLYIKTYNKINEDIFLKEKSWSDLHNFIKDFKDILEYIKNLNKTNIWLMGHCSSTILISIIYDLNQYNHLYKGMIFLNPYWKNNWKETELDELKFFLTKVNKPILIIQHAEDPCQGTHTKIAKRIVNDINNDTLTKYVELNGGIDQGCPHFSLGYHGFRSIENKVINEINAFISIDLK